MGLVEDKDFVAIASRGKRGSFAQLASIIHAVVARGVDFDDIHRATATARKFNTTGTNATWRICWSLCTIQATGEDARRRRLATTSRSAE